MRKIIIEISNEDLAACDMAGLNTQTLAKMITSELNSGAGRYMPEDETCIFLRNLKAKASKPEKAQPVVSKIHTEVLGGNAYDATGFINKMGWAKYLLSLDSSGRSAVAVFRMPAEMVYEIREKANYDDPHCDDPRG